MNAAPVRIPRVKPPDKKKYEEEMEVLSNTIKAKENQLVSFFIIIASISTPYQI